MLSTLFVTGQLQQAERKTETKHLGFVAQWTKSDDKNASYITYFYYTRFDDACFVNFSSRIGNEIYVPCEKIQHVFDKNTP
jgi:hypothetical protein